MNLEWFLFEFAGLFYIKASVLLAMAIVASLLLRHYSASTRYRAWNLSLILLLVLIPASVLTPDWDLSFIAPPGYSSLPPVESVKFAGEGIPAKAIPDLLQTNAFDTNHDLSFWELVWISAIALWILGMVVLLGKLCADLVSLGVTSHRGRPAPDELEELIEISRLRAGCRQRVKVRFSDRIGSPLIWGLFRPTVLLPAKASQWSRERLEMVLLHELLHAARLDHTMMVASQLVRCVYWTNPLAWFAVHRHSIERELSCDERVVDCGNDRLIYAEELVAITRDLRSEVRYASVAMTQQYGLKTRVRLLLAEHLGLRHLNRPLARALVAVAFLITMSVATASIIAKPDPDSTEALVATLFGSDISLADEAALRLGERGDKAAVPYLAKVARDSGNMHTRQQSLLAMGKIGGDEALEDLIYAFDDEDQWIRYTVLKALEEFKPKYTKEIQWSAWKDDPSTHVRLRAYLALAEADHVDDPRAVMDWLYDPDPEVRKHSVKITGRVCATKAAAAWQKENKETVGKDYCVHKLEKKLVDEDAHVREAAVEALAALGSQASKEALDANIPKMDPDLQILARAALESMQAR